MNNEKLNAIYKNNLIELYIPLNFYLSNSTSFYLYEGENISKELSSNSRVQSNNDFIVFIDAKDVSFIPGHEYFIATKDNHFIPIDYSSMALNNKEFEEKYRYDGKLGLTYTKTKSTFRVFSPFSSQIILIIQKHNSKNKESYIMNHNYDNGIFEISINGDYELAKYYFLVTMFSSTFKVIDPYSYSVDSNSRNSYVIDISKIRELPSSREYLSPYLGSTSSIIYELNVRDMTSLSNIKNKGKYLGLVEKGNKEKDVKVGIDYLKEIKPTHVELLPILDFQTIDDNNISSTYNWGYDPLLYFTFEGSYSTSPNDPYSRLKEVKQMISSLHKNDIRVILDVVYNHVYSNIYNPLNLLCPNYYFRLNDNLTLSKGSGCGNELESRNYMVRKLIIDSTTNLVTNYDIDGLRFDLITLIDIDTLNLLANAIKHIKKDFIFIGEGWDLNTSLRYEEKASMNNASKLPDFIFFNDRFRDIVKGNSSESMQHVKGYLLGDTNYFDGFKHVFLGSTNNIAFAPLFENVYQSLNYVECHDNFTLYDKIKVANESCSQEEILSRIKLINVAILFSLGTAYFHMGQEFGQSKDMLPNTYNAGDLINGFNFEVASSRKKMIEFFSGAIKTKKEFVTLAGKYYKKLEEIISFDSLPGGAIKITYNFPTFNYYIIFNPTNDMFMHSFDEKVQHIFSNNGIEKNKEYLSLAMIEPVSVNIYKSKGRK